MSFKRPIAAVRTVTPAILGAPILKDFMADLYTYLSANIVIGVSLNSGGAGYVEGDLLSVSGGEGNTALLRVTGAAGGVILTVAVAAGGGGAYTSDPPTTANAVTGGSGAGASVDLSLYKNWVVSNPESVTSEIGVLAASANSDGANYLIGDILTIVGGTGTPATVKVTSLAFDSLVKSVEIVTRGLYSSAPGTSGVGTTGGSGNGSATLDLTVGDLVGGYSFTATPTRKPGSLAQRFQLNFRNINTQAADSTTTAFIGINPDGRTDPIDDSKDPSNSNGGGAGTRANFSGDGAAANLQYGTRSWETGTITQGQYLILDFDDALVVFYYDTTRSLSPRAWHAGLIFETRYSSDIDGDSGTVGTRLDGLGILGYTPSVNGSSSTTGHWWDESGDSKSIARASTGNSIAAATSTEGFPWAMGMTTLLINSASTYTFGPKGDIRVCPLTCHKANSSSLYLCLVFGEYKYMKASIPEVPFTKRVNGSEDFLVYMHSTANSGPLCFHTPTTLSPKTDGTYI